MQRHQALIVDGYNVIRNNARYSQGVDDDFEGGEGWNDARDVLINDAAYYAQGRFEECTVVFDGAGNPESTGETRSRAGIDVIFSAAGVSADSVIERLAHDARERGLEVVVVSSDAAVQSTVYGGGVTRMSAAAFGIDSERLEQDWRQDAVQPGPVKNTIAERIDPKVAAALERLLHGDKG